MEPSLPTPPPKLVQFVIHSYCVVLVQMVILKMASD